MNKTTVAGCAIALMVAGFVGVLVYTLTVTNNATNLTGPAYSQGKKDGIVEILCADANKQLTPYVRKHFPAPRDPLQEAVNKCPTCKEPKR